MHYQNKPDPELRISELQNLLHWKKMLPLQTPILCYTERPQGLQAISDLAFNTGTQYLYPDPMA